MTEHLSEADAIQERLVDLAIAIIRLAAHLPPNPAGRHLAAQILRSGTSPAPNYGEARGAESRADFVHKLRIALKELNETAIWLQIIRKSRISNYNIDALIRGKPRTCPDHRHIDPNSVPKLQAK